MSGVSENEEDEKQTNVDFSQPEHQDTVRHVYRASDPGTEHRPDTGDPDSTAQADASASVFEPPSISVTSVVDTDAAGLSDKVSLTSDSTADQTLSVRSSSVRSAAAAGEDSRNVVTSQRSYLSPLRSKRYDSVRSSLTPPPGISRPGHLQLQSRSSSMASMVHLSELSDDHTVAKPREVVKWTRLRKITRYLHSEEGRRTYGRPTCLSVSGTLAIGTSKGMLLVFDYQQTCKHVIGLKTKAESYGAVTALSISADHTKAITGHEYGSIYTWDLRSPSTPITSIVPMGTDAGKQQGHRAGLRVTHVAFVGNDQTAVISGDLSGMLFYHKLNSRLFANSVTSVRLLGRYPETVAEMGLKPSTIYSLAVLPVGISPHFTDHIGLIAVLTPYKLVMISTRPVMRTQFKLSRPSGVLAEADAMSGAAAWYPASTSYVEKREGTSSTTRQPVLAVSWCRQILLLEVSEILAQNVEEPTSKAVPRINVHQISKYTCSESIVQLQWYDCEVLGALTRSSTMIFFDTGTWDTLGHCDLLSRQILHHDIYEDRLMEYYRHREAEYVDQSFAANYNYSLQIYKGKIFVIGATELLVGSFLTWADRLVAFTSAGQHIEAIKLLIGYYDGTLQSRGSGLTSDLHTRREKIRPKFLETILSSVKYTLASEDLATRSDTYHVQLLAVCFEACILLDRTSFLTDQIYEVYAEANRTDSFLDRLAIYILNEEIAIIPTTIIQDLIQWFTSQNLHTRLEDIICHLEPTTLDINQTVHLCKDNALYNALTYIYTEALRDYTAPLVEFFNLIKIVLSSTGDLESNSDTAMQMIGIYTVNAVKVFSYLSLTLCGQTFPLAKSRSKDTADEARCTVLNVLFADSNIVWPPASGNIITTVLDEIEPTFPYLRLLLRFDVPTFLASMDEAFEDSFLNADMERSEFISGSDQQLITRQFIVNILLDVMSTGFDPEDVLYLYIFIARNVPKYPQFIVLSGTLLQKIIVGLCEFRDPELADDCQLSVEYLLSVYHPANSSDMITHYRDAGFYRVLKGVYRADQRWSELLLAYLRDDDDELSLFDCIEEVLGPSSSLTSKQRTTVEKTIFENIVSIASLDGTRTTDVIMHCLTHMQYQVYEALLGRDGLLYIYLKRSFGVNPVASWITAKVRETYIDLLCIYDTAGLLDFVKSVKLDDIDVNKVIQNMETYDLIDAVLYLMSACGRQREASRKIVKQLSELYTTDSQDSTAKVEAPLASKDRTFTTYAALGCDLCQADTLDHVDAQQDVKLQEFGAHYESMWAEFLTAVVGTYVSSQRTSDSTFVASKKERSARKRALRTVVQDVFSRFLVSTYTRDPAAVVRILRVWMTGVDNRSNSTSSLRPILKDVFDTYQYYFQLLALAERVLNRDLYRHVAERNESYVRGWKVLQGTCTICHQSVDQGGYQRYRFQTRQSEMQKAKVTRRKAGLARVMTEQGYLPDSIQKVSAVPDSTSGNAMKLTSKSKLSFTLGDVALISHACGHMTHDKCHTEHRTKTNQGLIHCPLCDSDAQNNFLASPQ